MVSYDEGNSFVWKTDLKSPLQRVEVSPDSSPELPRFRQSLRAHPHQRGGSWNNGFFTIPTARPSVTERSPRTLAQSSRRYARSDLVRGTDWYEPTHSSGAVNRPLNQPISQPRPVVRRDDVLLHSNPYPTYEAQRALQHSSYGSHRQVGGQAGMAGQDGLGGSAWLHQVKRASRRSDTLKQGSYPASVISMEVDGSGRKGTARLQVQQASVTER